MKTDFHNKDLALSLEDVYKTWTPGPWTAHIIRPFEPCLQFKLERRSEHAIQFYKLSVNFKRPVFDKWTMLRNWVHRGGPWTGSKEVVHGPGPKGWGCFGVPR